MSAIIIYLATWLARKGQPVSEPVSAVAGADAVRSRGMTRPVRALILLAMSLASWALILAPIWVSLR